MAPKTNQVTTDEPGLPDAMHFAAITLQNVRAFGGTQTLELTNLDGTPSRWCLLLGENGVGKTTILQSLALMKPAPAAPGRPSKSDHGPPSMSEADLSSRENAEIERLLRIGTRETALDAMLLDERGTKCRLQAKISHQGGKIKDAKFPRTRYSLKSSGPLVIGYGAARHVGHGNKSDVSARDSTSSLFSDSVDLYDAEELLEELDHAARSGSKELIKRDKRRLETIYVAIASLLEGKSRDDIEFRGPKAPGRTPDQCGVHIRTQSGTVALAELSLGYQSMFAWTVDLAFRLLEAFPNSRNPMRESAIVLIDEIDLHLHPRWQREIRVHLLKHFPKVQFIATTHSPITAQETLADGGRVAVVRWERNSAVIVSDPVPQQDWRLDQLMTSALFQFSGARSAAAEKKMTRRAILSQKEALTAAEKRELARLDKFATSLPFGDHVTDPEVTDLLAEYRRLGGTSE